MAEQTNATSDAIRKTYIPDPMPECSLTIVTVLNIAMAEATKLVKTARPLSNLVNEASITRPARAISAPSMSEHSPLNKRYTSPP